MSGTTMAFLIVLIAVGGATIRHYIDRKYPKGEKGTAQSGADSKRFDTLEERVRVLERIVTDKSNRLKDEIDGL